MGEPHDTWSEFLSTTRLLHSAMIAFDDEAATMQGKPPEEELHWRDGRSHYRVFIRDHVRVLRARHVFFAQTLMQSWSHCERFGRFAIEQNWPPPGPTQAKLYSMAALSSSAAPAEVAGEVVRRSGAPAWGRAVLDLAARKWADLLDGEAGFFEASIVRNALVHGTTHATQQMVDKVANVGGAFPWAAGQRIELDYQTLRRIRDRIRSFGRVIAPRTKFI